MSRGGSRYGAGRPALHAKTSHYLRLDVRDLHRRGSLTPGTSYGWTWTRDGKQVGSVGVRIESHAVHLDYARDGKTEHVELRLQRTSCQYGGNRPWFTCPRCGRRMAIIFLANDPACRKCLRLRYPSQSNDPIGRSWVRTYKVMRRLGQGQDLHDVPRRPKGMRTRTYDRLRATWIREDQFRDDALAVFVATHYAAWL